MKVLLKKAEDAFEVIKWRLKGSPVPPPPEAKQRRISKLARKYKCKVLVETGTYLGEMIDAQLSNFEEIYSIELSEFHFHNALKRFSSNNSVKIVLGDSAAKLDGIVSEIKVPALFWLDGHYSAGNTALGDKETPILEELTAIFRYPDYGHVILIDDAREFGINPDYPTINEITEVLKNARLNCNTIVEDDCIISTPSRI